MVPIKTESNCDGRTVPNLEHNGTGKNCKWCKHHIIDGWNHCCIECVQSLHQAQAPICNCKLLKKHTCSKHSNAMRQKRRRRGRLTMGKKPSSAVKTWNCCTICKGTMRLYWTNPFDMSQGLDKKSTEKMGEIPCLNSSSVLKHRWRQP
jgi:hypothetical protein